MARVIPDWPRMLRKSTAAAYCDLSSAEFDREVIAGRLPMPVMLGNSEHWSRTALDERLSALSGEGGADWRSRSKAYAA